MSNRADFLEMREREAQESPVIEREEERKPKLTKLELRARAYENKVLKNKIKKFGLDYVLRELNKKRTDMSSLDTRPLHNHAKPLTAIQKLYHIPTQKHDEKELPTTDKIQESFSKFKKSRGI